MERCGGVLEAIKSLDDEMMDESNLFRLAVPLLPLIGWDLTPVILKTNCMTRPQQASNIPSKCVTQ